MRYVCWLMFNVVLQSNRAEAVMLSEAVMSGEGEYMYSVNTIREEVVNELRLILRTRHTELRER